MWAHTPGTPVTESSVSSLAEVFKRSAAFSTYKTIKVIIWALKNEIHHRLDYYLLAPIGSGSENNESCCL